jgi:hypothetical protein
VELDASDPLNWYGINETLELISDNGQVTLGALGRAGLHALNTLDLPVNGAERLAELVRQMRDLPDHVVRCRLCGRVAYRHHKGALPAGRLVVVCPAHGPLKDITFVQWISRAAVAGSNSLLYSWLRSARRISASSIERDR